MIEQKESEEQDACRSQNHPIEVEWIWLTVRAIKLLAAIYGTVRWNVVCPPRNGFQHRARLGSRIVCVSHMSLCVPINAIGARHIHLNYYL